jgi:hypothetical protein
LIQSVTPAIATVNVGSSAPSVPAGQSVTLTATVSGFAPTGTVQFIDGGNNLGTTVTLTGGTATLTLSTLAAGNHDISATYSGDANNTGGASPAFTQTITAVNPAVPALSGWAIALLGAMLLAMLGYQRRHLN